MWFKTFSAVLVAGLLTAAALFTAFKIDGNMDRTAAAWNKDASDWTRIIRDQYILVFDRNSAMTPLKNSLDLAEGLVRRAPGRCDSEIRNKLEWEIKRANNLLTERTKS